ncbi:CD63 antigen-like isoform X1 [Gadus macrocephalus]|uniref:CD63 antigen-like isoform X1 n=1 Tax=Gadus macrocephalus TaxID=80720 RepID=UPI0028CBB731|nr:CD63 antigen-like isoform X1 [Gadus macrocephalus]
MGKINGCLKCVFVLLNALFVIFGVLMIIGLVKAHPQLSSQMGPGSWAGLWVFSVGMLLVSILGLTAAKTEKTALLKGFAGLMGAIMIIMMILGIVMASYRNQLKNIPPDFVRQMMADNTVQEGLDNVQGQLQCCGLMSYEDWGNRIPLSCECLEDNVCTDRPGHLEGPAKIYSRPCFPIVSDLLVYALTFSMGVFFVFAVTALLCLGASLLMIGQVRRHDGGRGGQAIAMMTPGYKLIPGI